MTAQNNKIYQDTRTPLILSHDNASGAFLLFMSQDVAVVVSGIV
ncbi:MAG: hypothetical protein H6Q68_3796 [Firmicutes bacterium]|nr:hypothetical protein [Bacillota bacterium]